MNAYLTGWVATLATRTFLAVAPRSRCTAYVLRRTYTYMAAR